jgi:type II secretory pathway predicted ATPase ExeA
MRAFNSLLKKGRIQGAFMKHHKASPSLATLLRQFKPAQQFVTERSRSALACLRDVFKEGRPLAVLDGGWSRGSNDLMQRFLADIETTVSVARVPASCLTETDGMRELVRSVGIDPGNLSAADMQRRFATYLDFQKTNDRRTIVILEDSDITHGWVHKYADRLLAQQVQENSELTVIIVRQGKAGQIPDARPPVSSACRTAKNISLTPFASAETARFIRWRMDVPESADISRILDIQAITLMHELCDGMPDAIEQLCCASLALADGEDTAPVTTAVVMRATKKLQARATRRQSDVIESPTMLQKDGIPTLKLPDCPRIVLSYNGTTLRQLPVNQQRISIGRDSDNDLCIDSPFVSRQHATIYRNGADTAIVDLESKNGTFVNSQPVQVQSISDQDIIFIGYHQIRFLDPDRASSQPLNGLDQDSSALANGAKHIANVTIAANTGAARK